MPTTDLDEEAPPLLDGGESPRAATGFRPGSLNFVGGGLLSSVLGGLGSPRASDDAPLLPGGEEQEQSYIEHVLEPKQWPQLRGSSVSARRITHPAAAALQEQPSTPSASTAPGTPLAGALGLPTAFQAEHASEAGYSALPTEPTAAAKASQQPAAGRHARAAVAGVVNSVIALPLQLSFAAIIFRVSCWV